MARSQDEPLSATTKVTFPTNINDVKSDPELNLACFDLRPLQLGRFWNNTEVCAGGCAELILSGSKWRHGVVQGGVIIDVLNKEPNFRVFDPKLPNSNNKIIADNFDGLKHDNRLRNNRLI